MCPDDIIEEEVFNDKKLKDLKLSLEAHQMICRSPKKGVTPKHKESPCQLRIKDTAFHIDLEDLWE